MRRVGGRFVLVRELGVGGISRVYLGRDEVLDRPVAVKILHPDLDDEETGDRFRREGRMSAKLSHPNIVQVYDAGEDVVEGREVSYIVMEYVPGGDLKTLMDRRGSLPEGMLSRLGADVAGALAHAHERGVIHRDVKPQNVLLDDRGNPKLADFGIARALETSTTPQSRTGSYLGTAAYSSPEQLRGDKVTPKADVYALGTTLYHAAAGEPPFSGAPIEVANQHILKRPVPPRERGAPVGRGFETLVLDCLQKDPSKRPDASRVHAKLLQRGSAAAPNVAAPAMPGNGRGRRSTKVAGSAGPAGDGGISRAVGTARSAGASGLESVRKRLDRAPSPGAEGPPDETINFPTRTFRSGSRQRALILLAGAVLVLLLLGGGLWALLGSGGETTRSPNSGSNEQREAAAAGQPEEEANQPPEQEPAEEPSGDGSGGSEAASESEAPAPPLGQARRAVFDLYVDMSYREVETTWNTLSSRLQNEIGSPKAWARQERIYTFTYMEYIQVPQAEAAGDEARVSFEARLDREEGSEILSGTWVCVNEGGQWKLDRLEDEQSTSA